MPPGRPTSRTSSIVRQDPIAPAFAFFRKEESQTLSLEKKAEMAFLFPLVLVMVSIR